MRQLAEAWQVDLRRHIIRPYDYKGKKVAKAEIPVVIRFNGVTCPGYLLMAAGI